LSIVLDSKRTVPNHFFRNVRSSKKTNTDENGLCLALGGLLLGLLEDLLDDLLLLNQEGTDNAVLDATSATRATVGTADVLLGAGDLGVLAGAESGDLD
jgi:hypothetical protein